mmetsp:Transcript_14375/g.33788  ORF Transcript_14375/g.33788 Transcript_14375/m.33788 type:complete len:292 (-) Transcript_14375:66-941(-)
MGMHTHFYKCRVCKQRIHTTCIQDLEFGMCPGIRQDQVSEAAKQYEEVDALVVSLKDPQSLQGTAKVVANNCKEKGVDWAIDFFDRGGLGATLSLLDADDAHRHTAGLTVTHALANHHDLRAGLARGDVLPRLLALLRPHQANPIVLDATISLLILARERCLRTQVAEVIMCSGATDSLLAILDQGPDFDIRSNAAGILAAASERSLALSQAIAASPALAAVVEALGQIGHPTLQRECVRLVHALASAGGEAVNKRLNQVGAPEMLAALAAWGRDSDTRRAATKAAARLAT